MKKRLTKLLKDGRSAAAASLPSSSSKFLANEQGAIAIVAAVMLPVAIGVIALAVEFGHGLLIRDETQRVADEAAYAAALAYVATSSQTSMLSAARNVAVLNGVAATAVTASLVTSPVTSSDQAVQATVKTDEPIVFGQVLGFGGSVAIQSTSYAQIPSPTPCVLALSSSGQGVLLSGGTNLSAPSCVVASQASVAVPCGTHLTGKDVYYNGSAPTVGCSGITGAIKKVSSSDPLAGNAGVIAANARAVSDETLAGPTMLSTPPSEPAISFGWSGSPQMPAGCTATWSSSSSTWAVTCTSGGTYNFGSVSLGGGITVNFNVNGSASTTYNFSGTVTNSGTSLNFGPGTFNLAQGLVTDGGSTTTFGAGTFNIGPGPSCSGANYSICHTGSSLTFGGPSTFVLTSGVYNSGGETITFGAGSTNSYEIGAASNHNAFYLGGGSTTTLADATGSSSVFQMVGNLVQGGGSCITLPAATTHDINGSVSLSGGLTLGSGLYAIADNLWIGASSGGDVWCQSVNANVGVSGSNVTIAIAGSSSMPVSTPSGAGSNVFVIGAGFNHVTLSAPTSGTYENVTIVGPLQTYTGGVSLTEGASATTVDGALYFPIGPMALSGGASIGNGAGQCLEIVATQITLSGGTAISASPCFAPATETPLLVE